MPNPSVKFDYSIVASWKGDQPQDHPANTTEACGISVSVIPDLYYVSDTNKGGKLKPGHEPSPKLGPRAVNHLCLVDRP